MGVKQGLINAITMYNEIMKHNCLCNCFDDMITEDLRRILTRLQSIAVFTSGSAGVSSISSINLTRQVIVLKPSVLDPKYQLCRYQLWYATGGFGCDPNAMGRAVFATCLYDGEFTRWDRSDILGAYAGPFIVHCSCENGCEKCHETTFRLVETIYN